MCVYRSRAIPVTVTARTLTVVLFQKHNKPGFTTSRMSFDIIPAEIEIESPGFLVFDLIDGYVWVGRGEEVY